MNLKKVEYAKKEAIELLQRINIVEQKVRDYKFAFYGCKETAALKRKSMDLSRALSEMRKSN